MTLHNWLDNTLNRTLKTNVKRQLVETRVIVDHIKQQTNQSNNAVSKTQPVSTDFP